jgi:outer membrane protein TolC
VLNAETEVLTARQTMVDIRTSQAVARVTLLLAVGGSFDPRASGNLATARHSEPSSHMLTRTTP